MQNNPENQNICSERIKLIDDLHESFKKQYDGLPQGRKQTIHFKLAEEFKQALNSISAQTFRKYCSNFKLIPDKNQEKIIAAIIATTVYIFHEYSHEMKESANNVENLLPLLKNLSKYSLNHEKNI